MKNYLLLLGISLTLILSLASNKTHATHLMGGEITWECQPNGEYLFTFKVYRDCSGNNISPEQSGLIQIHNYPSNITNSVIQIPSSQWTIVSNSDIAPDCGTSGFNCANGDPEAVYEYVRQFSRRLNGTPPPEGWIITYDDVARNANDNIQGQPGVTLRAKILPHSGTVADTCIDNSPQFQEIATSLVCASKPFKYNHNATDAELDSLVYEWARPLNAIGTNQLYVEGNTPSPVSFQSGFSYTSPFPGTNLDPRNVPATLDPNTGEINLTSYTQGKYVSVVKVTAYKCQEPVAEIYRELQSNLANSTLCAGNDAPIIRPPFRDGNGNYTLWNDTVNAGDFISFPIQIQDFTSIAQRGGDSITLSATGFQFGTNYTSSTTGCLNPPCATLSTTLPQKGFVGVGNTFSWQTDCQHTSFTDLCVSGQNTYTFVITAEDDVCPLPLKSIATISITVLADSVITSPLFHCVDVLPNGDVNLDWNLTPDPNNSFSAWMIYSATDENGPYSLVDSVKTYNQSSYTHTGAGADTQRRWYYIRSRSGCRGIVQNVARDTVSTIFAEPILTESCIGADWNPLSNPNPSGSAAQYDVYRDYPIGSGFSLQTSTSLDSLCETFTACQDSVAYRIELVNITESCTSTSNTLRFSFDRTPQTDFSFSANPCLGQPVNFTNLTTAIGGTPTYSWDFGDGSPTSTATNPTHTYSGPGPFTVTLTASNGAGCDSSISKQISLGPDVSAGPDTVLCPGNSVQIGGPVSGVSPLTFSWSPTASLSNPNIQFPTASPTITTTYSLTVTDGNGCSNTDQMQVTVVPNPSADAGADRTICSGDDIMIGGAPTGPASATFQWNNAATLDDPNDPNPMASPTTTTTYTVTVSVGNNCTDTDQMTVFVNPSPTANAGADEDICEGGSVQLGATATGGAGGYSYNWSPTTGLSNPNIQQPIANPTTTTTYTVTVTDALGCTDEDQMTVNVNDQPTVDFSFSNLCEGKATQFTDLSTVNSGTLSSWSWDFGDGIGSSSIQNPSYTYASAGSYTVELVVTSSFGCKDSITKNVTIASLPTADAGADDDICAGENIQIGTASTVGYTFAWNNTATLSSATVSNPTATPTTTTTYTVTVTETATGCTNTDQVTITVNPLPTADAGPDQNICENESVQIGTAAIVGNTYAWDNGASLSSATVAEPTATPLSTITYTVTVTETATGCTNTDQVIVTVNDVPTADFTFSDLCEGDQTQFTDASTIASGSINSWTWDFGDGVGSSTQQNPTYQYASAGTYTVELIVGSALACADTITKSVTIEPLPTADAGADQTICNRDTVQIGTASTVGYSYAWNNASTLSSASISNPNAFPSTTTTYTVTVTENSTTCTATDQVTITVNSIPNASFTVADTCIGSTTTFDGSPSGVSTYSWNFGDGIGTSNLEDPTYTYGSTGVYTVKLVVENGAGCKDSVSRNIEIKSLPTADAGADDSTCVPNSVQIGSPSINGYTYTWNNGSSLNSTTISNPTATPLSTTTYTVTVTETASGCTNTDQVTIVASNPPSVATVGGPYPICLGDTVQIGTPAIAGYAYAWNNPSTLSDPNIAQPFAFPLVTTNYTLTVTDVVTGCTSTDNGTVNIIPQPFGVAMSFTGVCLGNPTIFDGMPNNHPTNSYRWDFGDGIGTSNQEDPNYQYTSAGTYTVELIVTNNQGCPDTATSNITIINAPTANAGADQTICDRDTVQIGSASTVGYTYSWNNAASLSNASISNPNAFPSSTTTYTVTVTDNSTTCTATDQVTITVNSVPNASFTVLDTCIGSTTTFDGSPSGASTYSWNFGDGIGTSNLEDPTYTYGSTGVYTVKLVVENGAGCKDSVSRNIEIKSLPTADAGADDDICAGENIQIGSPAVLGYTYSWNNAASLSSATVSNPTATPTTTTTYTVTVTETATGCTNTDQVTITVNPLPTADAGPDQNICENESVQIGTAAIGGNTYAWDNGASLSSATVAEPTATPLSTTTYTVTVTETATGCTNTDQVIVTVNDVPTADFTFSDLCEGDQTQFTDASNIASSSINSWTWDFGDGVGSSTQQNPTYQYASAGTYTVELIVGSVLACADTITKSVTIEPLPTADAGVDQTICDRDTVQIGSASTAGYTYNWNNAASLSNASISNPNAFPSTTTTYTVTVTDNSTTCTATDQVTITVNPLAVVDFTYSQSCLGDVTQFTDASTIASGSLNSWNWDFGDGVGTSIQQNPSYTYSSAGSYSVTLVVGSIQGCIDSITKTISIDTLPIADAGADQTICAQDTATLGGQSVQTFTYSWSNSSTLDDASAANPKAFPTTTTTYFLTVTDGNGCTDVDEVIVSVNDLPIVDAGPDQIICKNDSVQIGGSPTGATAISYLWTPVNGLSDATVANPMASPQDTTKYYVQITDANGCVNIDSVTVFTNPLPQVSFTVDERCLGNFAAFTDQSTISTGSISNWSWDFGDGIGSSSLQNAAYQYASAGIYDVTLVVTSSAGCVDSITQSVEIYNLPNIDAGGFIEICYGDTVELGGNPTGPSSATYSWSPSTDLSDVTAMNPMAYPLSTTKYALSVSDANGCINYDTAEVKVNPLPDVIASPDTAICIDEPTQLNASGAINYSWLPNTFLDDAQIAMPTVVANKSITYVVFGSDVNGCINTDTVVVDVFNVEFKPSDTNVCFNDSIQLLPIIEGDTSGIQYYWSPNIGLNNHLILSPLASPPVDQEYFLQITNADGCYDKDSINLEVDATANLSFNYNYSARCTGAILEIENTSTNTDEFIWTVNGTEMSRDYEPSFELDFSVENEIILSGENSLCSDSIVKIIPAHTFDEVVELNKTNVFSPNGDGINDLFFTGLDGKFIGCASLLIFNRSGQRVYESNISEYGWDGRTVDGKRAAEGTYFYIIKVAGKEIKGSVFLSR